VLFRIELLIEWDQNEQRSKLNVYMPFLMGYVFFDINSIRGSVYIQLVIDMLRVRSVLYTLSLTTEVAM